MGLDHISKECKGHLTHITTLTKTHPFPLRAPLLIPPSLHLLLSLLHLCTILSQPTDHFSHILQNLSGMHNPKGGGPHIICSIFIPFTSYSTVNFTAYSTKTSSNASPTKSEPEQEEGTTSIQWRDIPPCLCCGNSRNQLEF